MKRTFTLRKLRGAFVWLVLGFLGAVGIVTIVLMQRREVVEDVKTNVPISAPQADVSLGKISQVSTKDGRVQWRLEAESAFMMEEKNHLGLDRVTMVFFLQDGREVYLTGDTGTVNTQTKDIAVEGNVVVVNDKYRMTTDRLEYNDKKRILSTPSAVNLTDGVSTLVADRVLYNLDTKQSVFNGNVAGLFHSQFVK
jgi:LPS export ABC transporter protein LptC